MRKSILRWAPVAMTALAGMAWVGCSSDGDSDLIAGGDFVVLQTEPQANGQLFLNDAIRIDFSQPVDLSTANLNTFSFAVFDLGGRPLAEQPVGTFRLSASPGDTSPGRRLEFVPRFPTSDAYDNGGFRPGRRYVLQLVGGDQRNANVLRDSRGKALLTGRSLEFRTADGTTPSQLFRDLEPGGPRRVAFEVGPRDTSGVALNRTGQAPVQIRLRFDQPLDPASTNVPYNVSRDPAQQNSGQRGKVFAEYADPAPNRDNPSWIPCAVDLVSNTPEGSEIVLTPLGVLPNNAEIRVIVENTLGDISGETNVNDASYSRVFGSFRTRSAYAPQFDAVVENFQNSDFLDLEAAFVEPLAEVGPSYVRGSFEFDGSRTVLDYQPTTSEVVLNTDFTQITPTGAPPINVAGGVFSFRNVTIQNGVTVRGTGSRPMVWLVTEDFTIETGGTLTVDGGAGTRVNTLRSANFPASGGAGVCTGGKGGAGSPNSTGRSPVGEPGFGANQTPGIGGGGGNGSPSSPCGKGAGGGGGSFATAGDPWYKNDAGNGTAYPQPKGQGGYGCTGSSGSGSRSLEGGQAGQAAFVDARDDNNFWGAGVNRQRKIRIIGELAAPRGGGGGGGGGDKFSTSDWISDEKGGGGGGGGGVLIVKALGKITIESDARITANGGNGGGGEQAGGNNKGGGGGAGAGGMIVLMAGKKIELFAQGGTYAQGNYDFVLSADGGICTQGSFGGSAFSNKYPPVTAGTYDRHGLGAFGGMGLIQLMAPPGRVDSSGGDPDNTGTILDNNIDCFGANNAKLTGQAKKDFLAWRGFPDDKGVPRDDFGNELTIGKKEGEMRPTPQLLPGQFGAKSRARSRFISSGASQRRPLTASDGAPRGIIEDKSNGFIAGPGYFFAGTAANTKTTQNTVGYDGYISYKQASSGGLEINYPTVTNDEAVVGFDTAATVEGLPAYRIDLNDPVLGSALDRYIGYQAVLRRGVTKVGAYRIVRHTDRALFVDASSAAPTDTTGLTVQVVAKFFELRVGGREGFGPSYGPSGNQIPEVNVRIGFAFHKNPADPRFVDPVKRAVDRNRFPNDVGSFIYDLSDPAMQKQVREFVGAPSNNYDVGAPFVAYDITFNTRFSPDLAQNDRSSQRLSPATQLPELRYLTLPFQF